MKYIRVTATPDLEAAPQIFQLLGASEHVDEARLLDWSFTDSEAITTLFAVRGDCRAFRTALADVPEVVEADVTPDDDQRFYFLATIRPPLFKDLFETFTKHGLLVITPVLYRDGEVHARFVGRSDVVQAALDHIPSAIDVQIHEIGERGFEQGSSGATLSDRQQEAVRVAIELGYYEIPRQVTYDDIAERLDCAPSTASEHLQKAESKLVREAMQQAMFSSTNPWTSSVESTGPGENTASDQ